MFGSNNNHSKNGTKRLVRSGHPISGSFDDYGIIIDHSKITKVTILKIIMYSFGISGSGYLLYFDVGGWHAKALWWVMGAFWIVQLARAIVKLIFEYKDQQLEHREKKARYNKDIFT